MQVENPFRGAGSYDEGDDFFGRKEEIKELVGLVRNETLTMLFSRSGTGKSSLLKAGLMPELRRQLEFFPIYLHINVAVINETANNSICSYVIQRCREKISSYFDGKENFVITLAADTEHVSLFEFIHFSEIKEVDTASETEYVIKPLLIFDQFEEIFTNPFDKNDLHFFLREINCLLENELPDYLREEALTDESSRFVRLKNTLKSKQKNFRIAIAFREEYLPQFESLRKEIPALRFTNSRYRLEPFTILTAQDIIISTAPDISADTARIVAENISTEMEGFEDRRVDPFLLSLICQIIYHDLAVVDEHSTLDPGTKIKALVDNAVEKYIEGVYNGIGEATKEFIETRLITSDGKKNSVNYNDVRTQEALNRDILHLVDDPEARLLSIGQFLDSRHITILHDRLLPPLINRKVKRENQVFAERREKYAREDRRRRRVAIGTFVFVMIVLVGILGYANQTKINAENYQESLKKEAKSALLLAYHETDSLKKRTEEIRISATKAYIKAQKDSLRNDSALKSSELKLYSQKRANNLLQSTIASLHRSIDSNFIWGDLDRLALEDRGLKKLLFDNLFDLWNTRQDEAYHNYYYAVAEALALKEAAASNDANSYDVLTRAKALWTPNRDNQVVGSIIKELLNKNLFYDQLINLPKDPYVYYNTFLSFPDDSISGSSKFVFNIDKNIYLGSVHSDKLEIGPGIYFPALEANATSGSSAQESNDYTTSFSRVDTAAINHLADTGAINQAGNYLSSLVYHQGQIYGMIRARLFGYSPVSKKYLPRSIRLEKHDFEVLSPDTRFLVTYSDYDSIRIRDLTRPDRPSTALNIRPYYNIRSAIFSRDSKKLLVLARANEFIVYDILTDNDTLVRQNTRIANMRADPIMAVNFTPEGNAVIAANSKAIYITPIKDKKSDTTFKANYFIPALPAYFSELRSISLSPDKKKILLQTPGSLVTLMKNNQTAFDPSDQLDLAGSILTYKYFNTSGYNSVSSFLNSNSLLLVTDVGKVYFIKIYPEFNSISEAFAQIRLPELNLLERLKIDPRNDQLFTEIASSTDNTLLVDAAQVIFYNYLYPNDYVQVKTDLDKARSLCKKFVYNEQNSKQATDLVSVRSGISLIKRMSGLDTSQFNHEQYYTDLLTLVDKYPGVQTNAELAVIYGNLSFYCFFNGHFEKGLAYAEKGLELDTRPNNYIYTNKALGYLFNKRFPEAEAVYQFYKDTIVLNRVDSFKKLFLEDLNDLEKYGVISPNDPVIYAEVEKIRAKILK